MNDLSDSRTGSKSSVTSSSAIGNKSWIDIMEEEEHKKENLKEGTNTNSSNCIGKIRVKSISSLRDHKRNRSEDRELLKEDKLKSPFKRRLSDNSDYSERSQESIDDYGKMSNKRSRMCGNPSSRNRQESSSSGGSSRTLEFETDASVLDRRQKQIDYGKNTIGYDNYIRLVPKDEREKEHPRTPQKHIKYSRRAFDGLIKIWRKHLHEFDQKNSNEESSEDQKDPEIKQEIE